MAPSMAPIDSTTGDDSGDDSAKQLSLGNTVTKIDLDSVLIEQVEVTVFSDTVTQSNKRKENHISTQ